MAPQYAMVQFDEKTFAKWHARFGLELTLLMDQLVIREWMNTGGIHPIFIAFNGNPERFSEHATLESICLKKPEEVPNLLGKLMGRKATPHGRLIVFTAKKATA